MCATWPRPHASPRLAAFILASALLLACAEGARAARAEGKQEQPKAEQKRPTQQELPTVNVEGAALDEERLVGRNKQPEWTTERRFATARVYVLPPYQVEFEQWWRGTYKKDSSEKHRIQSEIGVGLPGRFQIDLYGNWESSKGQSMRYVADQIEGRWAVADWGRIWGNPTLYLEFKNYHHANNVVEGKLLLGGQLKRGWHWAVNLSYEEEQGGSREIERAYTFALSKSLRDSRFSVGIEGFWAAVTARGSAPERIFLVGPSFQWRPNDTVHLDFVPLFGATRDSPRSQLFVVLGINLSKGDKGKDVGGPVSSRSR